MGINVLSLFDGISCAQLALQRLGIDVDNYFSSEIDSYCLKITQANFPNTIQLGDVTTLDTSNLPHIDLLIGGSPCFVAGTKIFTKNGYKNIEDIHIGDLVMTHMDRFMPVVQTFKNMSNTIILKAQGMRTTETTSNHPYCTRTVSRTWNSNTKKYERTLSEPQWKDAGQLIRGDFIGLPIFQIEENSLNLTEEDCWLLGRYIADGHIRNEKRKERANGYHYSVIFSVGANKVEYFNKIVKCKHTSYLHGQSTYRCCIYSKRLVEIIKCLGCGHSAGTKVIPPGLLSLPKDLLSKVIEGYISGDGSNRITRFGVPESRASTISETLAMSLNLAIAKAYRVNSSIEFTEKPETTTICGRTVNQHSCYTISFKKELKGKSKAFIINNTIWLPIKEVIKTNLYKPVYNIEVDTDNTYLANNIIVHNCTGFSFIGKQLNFKDPQSKLFFDYVRVLSEVKPDYFILENVKMKNEFRSIITGFLGVPPIEINSALVSAQMRKRTYWTNIPDVTQPDDKGIFLKDILLPDAILPVVHNIHQGFNENQPRFYLDKSPTIVSSSGGGHIPSVVMSQGWHKWWAKNHVHQIKKGYSALNPDKAITMLARQYASWTGNFVTWKEFIRKLHPIECERLQTIPDNYTNQGVSDTQRYRALGNGFTVDVIAHILSFSGL